ncbi:MAG: helix-turn-helix transcriptional regulator [bacterium]|nr:helix-turn-helix transcriptional regulator [bacterium]
MELRTITHFLKLFTIFQLVFFSAFLASYKKNRKRGGRILALFLMANAVWYISTLRIEIPGPVRGVSSLFFFLIGPFLLGYIQSITTPGFSIKKYHFFHLFLFGILLLYSVIFAQGLKVLSPSRGLFSYLHFALYASISLWKLKIGRHRLKDHFSSFQRLQYAWLDVVTLGFLLVYGFFFLHFLGHLHEKLPLLPPLLPVSLFFILANVLIFKALSQPVLFTRLEAAGSEPQPASPGPKYAKTALPKAEMEHYLKKLLQYMEKEKPYLNASLTLSTLAQRLGVPGHYISQILNTSLNLNFYRFVNQYRVKESMKLLSADGPPKQTVLEVLYQCGFNSKSVFNTHFKKHTGMTPTQFLESKKK